MSHDTCATGAVLRIPYGPDPCQFGDLWLPAGPGPHPVLVSVHGGGWSAEHHLDIHDGLARDLAGRGFAVWNVEYRRLGNPGGGWPGTFLDVGRAVDHVRQLAPAHHLDLGRAVLFGHSAGGHLALWAAGRSRLPAGSPLAVPDSLPLAGVVSLAGITDLQQTYGLSPERAERVASLLGVHPDTGPERYRQASPRALLPLGLPQALLHGTADRHVPIDQSRDYVAAARAAGDDARLVELPGVDHFALVHPRSGAWAQARRTLLALAGQ